MRDPLVLIAFLRFDGPGADVAHMRQAIGDPVRMLLDGRDHVRQHGRAARPGDGEEVGETRDGEAQIIARAGAPFLRQREAAPAR